MKQYRMCFPGGLTKALTFSYDDGVTEDVRLARIFEDNGLKCTFNVNSGLLSPAGTSYDPARIAQRMTAEDIRKTYDNPLFEVACHSVDHPRLEHIDPAVAYGQILWDRQCLEQLFGRRVTGMAYPYGTYNDTVVALCRSAGIRYSRTVHATHSFEMPEEWLTLHPTCHHKDPQLEELGDRFLETKEKMPQMFYVWGHAYEFARDDNWHIIEHFAKKMAGKADIWYATNGEIADYCRDFGRLQFSADGLIVRNPTTQRLWMAVGTSTIVIAPGETRRLL